MVGEFPDGPLPEIQLATLKLPKNIPVSLPSNLIQQRPDIRASEALLHAACAQVGVATANLLPQLSMTSNYGWINTSLNNLFIPQHVVWSTLGQAAQPLLEEARCWLHAVQALRPINKQQHNTNKPF